MKGKSRGNGHGNRGNVRVSARRKNPPRNAGSQSAPVEPAPQPQPRFDDAEPEKEQEDGVGASSEGPVVVEVAAPVPDASSPANHPGSTSNPAGHRDHAYTSRANLKRKPPESTSKLRYEVGPTPARAEARNQREQPQLDEQANAAAGPQPPKSTVQTTRGAGKFKTPYPPRLDFSLSSGFSPFPLRTPFAAYQPHHPALRFGETPAVPAQLAWSPSMESPAMELGRGMDQLRQRLVAVTPAGVAIQGLPSDLYQGEDGFAGEQPPYGTDEFRVQGIVPAWEVELEEPLQPPDLPLHDDGGEGHAPDHEEVPTRKRSRHKRTLFDRAGNNRSGRLFEDSELFGTTGTQKMYDLPESPEVIEEPSTPEANRRKTWNGGGHRTPKMKIPEQVDDEDESPGPFRKPRSAPGGRKRRAQDQGKRTPKLARTMKTDRSSQDDNFQVPPRGSPTPAKRRNRRRIILPREETQLLDPPPNEEVLVLDDTDTPEVVVPKEAAPLIVAETIEASPRVAATPQPQPAFAPDSILRPQPVETPVEPVAQGAPKSAKPEESDDEEGSPSVLVRRRKKKSQGGRRSSKPANRKRLEVVNVVSPARPLSTNAPKPLSPEPAVQAPLEADFVAAEAPSPLQQPQQQPFDNLSAPHFSPVCNPPSLPADDSAHALQPSANFPNPFALPSSLRDLSPPRNLRWSDSEDFSALFESQRHSVPGVQSPHSEQPLGEQQASVANSQGLLQPSPLRFSQGPAAAVVGENTAQSSDGVVSPNILDVRRGSHRRPRKSFIPQPDRELERVRETPDRPTFEADEILDPSQVASTPGGVLFSVPEPLAQDERVEVEDDIDDDGSEDEHPTGAASFGLSHVQVVEPLFPMPSSDFEEQAGGLVVTATSPVKPSASLGSLLREPHFKSEAPLADEPVDLNGIPEEPIEEHESIVDEWVALGGMPADLAAQPEPIVEEQPRLLDVPTEPIEQPEEVQPVLAIVDQQLATDLGANVVVEEAREEIEAVVECDEVVEEPNVDEAIGAPSKSEGVLVVAAGTGIEGVDEIENDVEFGKGPEEGLAEKQQIAVARAELQVAETVAAVEKISVMQDAAMAVPLEDDPIPPVAAVDQGAARIPSSDLVDDDYRFNKFGVKSLDTLAKDAAYLARQKAAKRKPLHPNLTSPRNPVDFGKHKETVSETTSLFRSGKGKAIASAASRERALALFEDLGLDLAGTDSLPVIEFASAVAKDTSMRPEADKDAEPFKPPTIVRDQTEDADERNPDPAPLPPRVLGGGFSTAGGTKLATVSPEKLVAADHFLGSAQTPPRPAAQTIAQSPARGAGFATAAGRKLTAVTDEQLRSSENFLAGLGGNAASGSEGGQLLTDIARSPPRASSFPAAPNQQTPKARAGFSTATGKKLAEVNEEQIRRSEMLLSSTDGPRVKTGAGGGFATASGTKLAPLSAEQMERALQFFGPEDADGPFPAAKPHIKPSFGGGFAKATGVALAPVSAEQMEKAMQMLGSDDGGGNSVPRQPTEPEREPESEVRQHQPIELGVQQQPESTPAKPSLATPKDPFKKPDRLIPRPGVANNLATPESLHLRNQATKKRQFNTPFKAPSMIVPVGSSTDGLPTPLKTPGGPQSTGLKSRVLHNVAKAASDVTRVETPSKPTAPSYRSLFSVEDAPRDRTKLKQLVTEAIPERLAELPTAIVSMTPESALTFLFTTEKGPWGPQAAFGELIEAGAKLIDESWVKNHYKWIVWKLACLARRFAQTLDFWNPETVLNQLKYRYEQEVNLSRRSAIKMMLEQDGHPGRTLVLCVSAVMDDVQDGPSVELTDGWYSLGAKLDAQLTDAVRRGKIYVGLKLLISGARLTPGEACSPLEAPSHIKLKLSGNSTRRAKWDARLGYHRLNHLTVSLGSVNPDGGSISALDVVITRVYDPLYCEKMPDDTLKFRNQQEEDAAQKAHQDKFNLAMAAIRLEIEKDPSKFLNETPPPGRGSRSAGKVPLSQIDDGQELWELMQRQRDASAFQEQLTSVQRRLLSTYEETRRERQHQALQSEFNAQVEAIAPAKRNVSQLLRIKVCDTPRNGTAVVPYFEAEMTIWRPDPSLLERLREGHRYRISYLMVPQRRENGRFAGSTQVTRLSANKSSAWQPLPISQETKDLAGFRPRKYLSCVGLQDEKEGAEVDFVGLVLACWPWFTVSDDHGNARKLRNVILSDESGELVILRVRENFGTPYFWNGPLKEPFPASFVNVRYRGISQKHGVPMIAAFDSSVVKTEDRKPEARSRLESLAAFARNPTNVETLLANVDELARRDGQGVVGHEAQSSSQMAYGCTEQELLALSRLPSQLLRAVPLAPGPRQVACFGSFEPFAAVEPMATLAGKNVLRVHEGGESATSFASDSDSASAVQVTLCLSQPFYGAVKAILTFPTFLSALRAVLDGADPETSAPSWVDLKSGLPLPSSDLDQSTGLAGYLSSMRPVVEGALERDLVEFISSVLQTADILSSEAIKAAAEQLEDMDPLISDFSDVGRVLTQGSNRADDPTPAWIFTPDEWTLLVGELASLLCSETWRFDVTVLPKGSDQSVWVVRKLMPSRQGDDLLPNYLAGHL